MKSSAFRVLQNEIVSITNPLMSLWRNVCSKFENIILENQELFLLLNGWLMSYKSLWYWQNHSKYRIFQIWINFFSLSKTEEVVVGISFLALYNLILFAPPNKQYTLPYNLLFLNLSFTFPYSKVIGFKGISHINIRRAVLR